MTVSPPPTSRSRLPGIVALIAGVAGLGLLVFGIVRLVASIDTESPPSTVAFVTTTESPATTVAVTTTASSSGATGSVAAPEFGVLTDASGRLSVEMPVTWTDVSGAGWSVGGETVGVSIAAAVDRDAWYEGWGTPGAFLGISTVALDDFTPELVDFSGACTLADTGGREYPGFTTVVEEWVDCGDEGSDFTTALVWPSDFAWSGLIQIVALDGSSRELLDHMISTLSFTP